MSLRWSSALLKAWAISPLVLATVVIAREAARPGRLMPAQGPQVRIDLSLDASAVPSPDGEHSSLYETTPGGWVLRSGLGEVTALRDGHRRLHDAFFVSLKEIGAGAPALLVVRSGFFGPEGASLRPLVMSPGGARHLVVAEERPSSVTLQLDRDPAYRASSIVRALKLYR